VNVKREVKGSIGMELRIHEVDKGGDSEVDKGGAAGLTNMREAGHFDGFGWLTASKLRNQS